MFGQYELLVFSLKPVEIIWSEYNMKQVEKSYKEICFFHCSKCIYTNAKANLPTVTGVPK